MTRVWVLRVCLLVIATAAVVLAVVTVAGLVTGAGLPPLVTGCLAVSAGCAAVLLACGGGR